MVGWSCSDLSVAKSCNLSNSSIQGNGGPPRPEQTTPKSSNPTCLISVCVENVMNLPKSKGMSKGEPYCVIQLCASDPEKRYSEPFAMEMMPLLDQNGQPNLKKMFHFNIDQTKDPYIVFQVFEKNYIGTDFLGSVCCKILTLAHECADKSSFSMGQKIITQAYNTDPWNSYVLLKNAKKCTATLLLEGPPTENRRQHRREAGQLVISLDVVHSNPFRPASIFREIKSSNINELYQSAVRQQDVKYVHEVCLAAQKIQPCWSPDVWLAFEYQCPQLVYVLVDLHNANLMQPNRDGIVLAMEALRSPLLDAQLSSWLIDEGTPMETVDKRGWNLLFYAAEADSVQLVTKLISRVPVNAHAHNGSTALFYAKSNVMRQALVEFKADVNVVNEDGTTPLHVAVLQKDPKSVQFLLDRGAEIKADRKNRTAPDLLMDDDTVKEEMQVILSLLNDMVKVGREKGDLPELEDERTQDDEEHEAMRAKKEYISAQAHLQWKEFKKPNAFVKPAAMYIETNEDGKQAPLGLMADADGYPIWASQEDDETETSPLNRRRRRRCKLCCISGSPPGSPKKKGKFLAAKMVITNSQRIDEERIGREMQNIFSM